MAAIHCWKKQQRLGVRTHQLTKKMDDRKSFYLLTVLPALRLQRHDSDDTNKTERAVEKLKTHKSDGRERKTAISLFAVEGGDLKAESSVVRVDGHDGAVIEVRDQAARHLAAALLHQVPSLREEVLTFP